MNRKDLALLLTSALLTVAANLLMRAGVARGGGVTLFSPRAYTSLLSVMRQPLFLLGLVCYGAAAVVWLVVISSSALSTAYPLLVSITFLLVTLGAVWFFNETVTAKTIAGMLLILTGFFVLAGTKGK